AGGDLCEFLARSAGELATLFIVSEVKLYNLAEKPSGLLPTETIPELAVSVHSAPGQKCERCWMYHEGVGRDTAHPTVCPRCASVLQETGS
ncbi:MAG: zinc finger domain-containing protein, partial [Eubacteriales bacterium]